MGARRLLPCPALVAVAAVSESAEKRRRERRERELGVNGAKRRCVLIWVVLLQILFVLGFGETGALGILVA